MGGLCLGFTILEGNGYIKKFTYTLFAALSLSLSLSLMASSMPFATPHAT